MEKTGMKTKHHKLNRNNFQKSEQYTNLGIAFSGYTYSAVLEDYFF